MDGMEWRKRLGQAAAARQLWERSVNRARATTKADDYEEAMALNITYTTILDGIIASVYRADAA